MPIAARRQADQSMGSRPHRDACRRAADSGARHLRASYHIDFGAKAVTYVDTFMQTIHWAKC
jgi:hypothetical protein